MIFPNSKQVSFLPFPHPNAFTKVLPLSPGLSSGIALPAKFGAGFSCSGGCFLLSVCIIDPLIGDLLQGFLMAIFFHPLGTFFGRFASSFLQPCIAAALQGNTARSSLIQEVRQGNPCDLLQLLTHGGK